MKDIDIPEGWEKVELGNYIDLVGGFAFKSNDFKKKSPDTIPLIKIGDLQNGKVSLSDKTSYLPDSYFEDYDGFQLNIGDVLIAMSGATTGKIAVMKGDIKKALLNQRVGLFKIVKTDKVDSEFFFHYSQSKDFKILIQKNIGQSAQGNISPTDIKKIKVLFPPKDYQKLIAKFLSIFDEDLEQINLAIKKTIKIKTGFLNKLLFEGISNKEFKEEKIGLKKYSIPKKWDVNNLASTSTLKGRIGWQGLTRKEYLKEGDYFLVTGTDFKNGKVDWNSCFYVKKDRYDQDDNIQLQPEDILITKDGSIGKVAFVDDVPKPATLNSGVFVIRPVNKSYYPRFVYWVMHSIFFKSFMNVVAGSTIAHLYQRDFVNFEFPIPPYNEQEEIAEILDTVDNKINLLKKKKAKLQLVKKGVMNDLLTGRKRIGVD